MNLLFKNKSFVIFSILISGIIYCQKPDIDNKINQLHAAKDKVLQVEILNDIGLLFIQSQPDSAIKYANDALKLSIQNNYQKGIAKAYYLLGKANYEKNNSNESLKYYDKAIDLLKQTDELKLLANAYFSAGMCLYDLGEFSQAKKYYSQVRGLSSNIKLDTLFAKSTLWMGIALSVTGETNEALKYHIEALNLAEKIGLKKIAGSATLEIGIAYSTMRNSDKAIEYYNKAVKLYKEANDQINLCATLSNLSNEYISLAKYDNAIQYTAQALKIAEKINDKIEIGTQQGVLCRLYTSLKQYSKAADFGYNAIKNLKAAGEEKRLITAYLNIGDLFVKSHNSLKAVDYLNKALKLAQELKTEEDLRICYLFLSQAYEAAGNFKQSLAYSKLFNSVSDSFFNIENSRQILDLQTKYESEKKEKENELLRVDKELQHQVIIKQYTVISMVGFGLLMMGIMVFILVRLNSQKKKMNTILNNQNDKLEQYSTRLEELNNTKDKFLSLIAHDLKNPFHTLMGIAGMLNEENSSLKEDEKRKLYDIMNKTLESSCNLLENLLKWAKSQTGIIEFKPEEVQLINVINKNLTLYEGSFHEKKINIKIEVNDGLTVIADRNMVETIIRNLLSNAIKYSLEGGEIIIKAIEENDEVKISVKDSGVGISEDNVKLLFRIDKVFSTRGTKEEKGNGLGLLVSKEFVEKHNGKIWVESTSGIGSTFNFTLPKIVMQ